jgi:hypothetical protein
MNKITKEELDKKVIEMLSKDKEFENKDIKVNFNSEELVKEINEKINSFKSLIQLSK